MKRSVYDYYPIALAEGEGAGTAYEYYVKAKLLARLFPKPPFPRRILVGGLPERYGLSLDFAILAQGWQAEILFVDEREDRLAQLARVYEQLQKAGLLTTQRLNYQLVSDLTQWKLADRFDLGLCCEVIQRLALDKQAGYVEQLGQYTKPAVIFAPNAGNPHHATSSGLNTVSLSHLKNLVEKGGYSCRSSGWLDVPPFPPGITRSENQRESALNSPWQRFLFWGVKVWADAEGLMPASFKEHKAHIVYIALH